MIYGMRQFREEGAEFPTDSILMEDDDFFRGPRDSNARADPLRQQLRFQYQYELLPQPQNSAVPRLLTVLLMDAANAVAVASMAVASAARTPPGPGAVAGPPYGMTPLQRQQQQQQLQQLGAVPGTLAGQAVNAAPVPCEICGRILDANDELLMNYRLCSDCFADPYRGNVYGLYNEYLLAVSKSQHKDVKNLVFVKELGNFSDNLVSRPMNERQFREFIIEKIKVIYLDPVIASIGYKFNLVLANTADTHAKKPIRAVYKCYKEQDQSFVSSVHVTYDLVTSILVVKFSHRVYNASKYPPAVVSAVHSAVDRLRSVRGPNVAYDSETALLVYDELVQSEGEVRDWLVSHGRTDFASGFSKFATVGTAAETTPAKVNGEKPQEEEDAEEEEEEEEPEDADVAEDDSDQADAEDATPEATRKPAPRQPHSVDPVFAD